MSASSASLATPVDALNDITYLELPEIGTELAAGAPFGIVESVKSTNDLYLPVNGEVIEVNDSVVDDPALLNEDPYEKGWLIKVRVTGTFATSKLMDKKAYDAKCASE